MAPVLGRYVRTLRLLPGSGRLYLAAEGLAAVAGGGMGVVFNLYIRSLGFEAGFLGTLLTLTAVGAGMGAVLGGRMVDRVGARRVLLVFSPVAAAGMATQVVSGAAEVLLVGGVVTGVGAAAYYVAAAPFLARNAGEAAHEDVFSLDTAIALAGGAVGAAAGGQVATELLRMGEDAVAAYRAVLVGAGAIGATSFLLLLRTRERDARILRSAQDDTLGIGCDASESQRRWGAVMREPVVGKLMVVAALIAVGAGLFAPYVNVFLVEELGATPAVYGWLSAAATATRLGATLLAPALAMRVGTARSIGVTQLVSVPLLLLMGFGPTLIVVGGAFLARGALMNMAAPLSVSFRMAAVPAALHGSANSAVWLADQVTRAGSTWAGGQLIERVGYRAPYAMTAACYVAASVLFLWWFGRATRAVATRR